eukprot:5100341-Heterocapsa_arctica.AAC.1
MDRKRRNYILECPIKNECGTEQNNSLTKDRLNSQFKRLTKSTELLTKVTKINKRLTRAAINQKTKSNT